LGGFLELRVIPIKFKQRQSEHEPNLTHDLTSETLILAHPKHQKIIQKKTSSKMKKNMVP
jgi:hypothetical protein